MVVKRVAPLSVAKISGVLYAIMGLVFGGLFSVIALIGGALAPEGAESGLAGMLFGVGAIVILPIFYGVVGFVVTAVMAVLYNVVASAVGGVEIDLQ